MFILQKADTWLFYYIRDMKFSCIYTIFNGYFLDYILESMYSVTLTLYNNHVVLYHQDCVWLLTRLSVHVLATLYISTVPTYCTE